MRDKINRFLKSSTDYPVIAALAAGLFPLGHYYNSNFFMINSWSHLLFFIGTFLLVPVLVFFSLHRLSSSINFLKKYQRFLIPVLNLCVFAALIVLSTYGLRKKILAVVLMLSFCIALLVYKHIKKIIVIQFIIAIMTFGMFIPKLFAYANNTHGWLKQPDDIEAVVFKKKPNVYVIQPDGYANFSELKRGYYNYINATFESFLNDKNFTFYDDFRSNYYSTLMTNSAIFNMKHHYYSFPSKNNGTTYDFRKTIVENSAAISIFKNNGYKTNLILEKSYFLVNRPQIQYDYSNISLNEVSYLDRGFKINKDVTSDLEVAINNNTATNNFYFIEKISPGHIATYQNKSEGKEREREIYLKKIEEANSWLKEIINLITRLDSNSLIIIVADHGGYVGMDYTAQCKVKQTDRDIVASIFSSTLAIKWPNNDVPDFSTELKTSVNLFRVLFSYLGDDKSYLKQLQDDKSYLVIEEGAPFGVYETIDENGEIVFEKVSN